MNINRTCERIIEFSFYALFIIVPLILTPYNYELFEFNKMLTVYFFAIIITAAWLIKMINQKKIILAKTPFNLPVILFLLSQILSTIFSIDPHTSLWGYYSRFNGGLMSSISYCLLFFAFVSNPVSVTKSLKVILSTASIVIIYGILEHFGIDKSIWVQDVQNRVFSTLGQPNWLAAYLIALLPLALFFKQKKFIIIFALLNLLCLWFTRSQSGIGAAAITLSLLFIYYIFKKRALKITLTAVLFFTCVYFFLSSPLAANNQKTRQLIETENLTRGGGSSSLLIRRVVWQGAVDIWQHYPIFGSGVETFAYSYYNFRPAVHNLLSEWDFLYNKAHNEYLNYLATTGAFGLAAYLLFIFSVIINFIKHPSPLFFGFISILITNFFGFSVVPIALFFWLFPAFSASLQISTDRPALPEKQLHNWQYISISLILLTTTYFILSTINMWRADRIFNLGHNLILANQIPKGNQALEKAIELSPNEPLFRSEYAESLAKLAYIYNATAAAKLAVSQSDLVIKSNPVHLNYWKSRIKIFLLLSKFDPNYAVTGVEAIQQAISLAPTDAKLYYNLGLIYQQLNQPELAHQALKTALELKPNYDLKISK